MTATIIVYIIAWLLPLTGVLLHLTGVISAGGGLADNAIANYMLSIVTVALTLLTAYVALKLFAIPGVRLRLRQAPEARRESMYQMLCRVRLVSILVVAIIDLVAWYLIGASSPLYLTAIMLVCLLFCIPRKEAPKIN